MTVEAHRQETAVRYRVYGHILSCNAPLHELEQTPSQDSTELAAREAPPRRASGLLLIGR